MSGDTLEFSFVADVANALKGLAQFDSKLDGTTANATAKSAKLQELFGGLGSKASEAGAKVNEAGSQMAAGLNRARVATDEEGNALTRMIMKIHEGAESIRTFQMRAKEFAEVYVGIFAVESVAEWARKMGEAAEKTEQLAAKTGMTVPQVQALSGAAKMSGTDIDVLVKGMSQMDNKAVTAAGHTSTTAKAFKAMGISANDGSTNMQRLLKIADQFHGMADGPNKVALSMQLFGKAGRDMIPFLNQGSAAIQQLMQKTQDLGAVNEHAVEQGAKLASSVNEAKVAWAGLGNTLTEAFGPLLTQLVDGFIGLVEAMHKSYEAGGAFRVICETITEVISGIGDILATVGQAFSDLFASSGGDAKGWGQVIKAVIDAVVIVFKAIITVVEIVALSFKSGFETIIGYAISWGGKIRTLFQIVEADLEILKIAFKTFGQVATDALMLRWGSIAADWDAGMAQIDNVVKRRGAQIVADAKSASDAAKGYLQSAAADDAKARGLVNKDLSKPTSNGPKHDDFKFKFGGAAGGGAGPDITNPAKGKNPKEKKGKDDLMQRLELELQQQKNAWDKEQLAQHTHIQFSLKQEADFWNSKLALAKGKNKDTQDIQKKANDAALKLQDEVFKAGIKKEQEELLDAKITADKKLAILKDLAAKEAKYYGADSPEAEAARREVIQFQQQTQKEFEVLQRKATMRRAELEDQRKLLTGEKSKLQIQLQQIDRESADRIQAIKDNDKLTDQAKQRLILQEQLNTAAEKYNTTLETQQAKADAIASKMTTMIEDVWQNGIGAMKKYFAELIADLLKAILKAIILNALMPGSGGSMGGAISSGLGKFFGFANGGSVDGDAPIIVGERGPELFYPGVAGKVINNRQSGFANDNGGGTFNYAPQIVLQASGNAAQDAQTLAQLKQEQRRHFAQIRTERSIPRWSK